jgi:flagellar basal body-associated protein FliL
MADKSEKAAKEEAEPKRGSNAPIVAAVMFMGLLNTAAVGGLGYLMVTKMNAPPAAAGGAAKTGEGDKPAEGSETDGTMASHGEDGAEPAATGDNAGHDNDEKPVKRTGPRGQMQQVQNIVVRLKDVEREHHARISLALEFKETAEKATVEASMVHIREAAIRYASDRRYDEMRGSRGMLDMKKQLNKEARALFGAEFTELYVTEFVAQ